MHLCGIDPGLSGAVAILALEGSLAALYDTPTLVLRTSRGTRQEYGVPGLVGLLAPYAAVGETTRVEAVCMAVARRVYAALQAAHVSSVHCAPRACSSVQSSAAPTVS